MIMIRSSKTVIESCGGEVAQHLNNRINYIVLPADNCAYKESKLYQHAAQTSIKFIVETEAFKLLSRMKIQFQQKQITTIITFQPNTYKSSLNLPADLYQLIMQYIYPLEIILKFRLVSKDWRN